MTRHPECTSMSGGLRVTALLLVLSIVSGCATTRKEPIAERSPSELNTWQASGRIAVTGADTGGSGSFVWQQHAAQSVVHIRGPIGIGSLRLTIDDRSLHIETGDGQSFDADAAQSELVERLGAEVPTRELRFWLVGEPAPGEHEWQNGADSNTLKQNAWRIDYQKYAITAGVKLPMKLVATSGPAKVRIVIDKWQLR